MVIRILFITKNNNYIKLNFNCTRLKKPGLIKAINPGKLGVLTFISGDEVLNYYRKFLK